ncbi:MAG: PD-(D/E)XK nuclease family protein [Acidobacteriota bacterium]
MKPAAGAASALLVGGSTAHRLAAASSWLDDALTAKFPGECPLVLADSRGAADDFIALHCRPKRTVRGAFGVRRTTPRRLAADVAIWALARADAAPVTGLGLEALAARAVDRQSRAGGLDYFAPVAETPGFPRAVAKTLQELRFHGVDGDKLRRHAERPTTDATRAARLRDLAGLLAAWSTLLEENRLADPPAVFESAVTCLDTGDSPVPPGPLLLLDVAPESPLETRFLKALAERCPMTLATGVEGDSESIQRLEEALGVNAEPVPEPRSEEPDGAQPTDALKRLRRQIFSGLDDDIGETAQDAPDDPLDAPSEDASVAFFGAPGEHREAAEIARRLLQLAEGGTHFDACAVALRDPESYLPLLEEAFARAEVPFRATRGTRRPDPAGRAFLALLRCAAERLSASRFAEYMSLGELPPVDDSGAPPPVDVPWVTPQGDQLVLSSLLSPTTESPAAELGDQGPAAKTSSPEDNPGATSDGPIIAGGLRTPRRWERLLVDAAVIEGKDRWRRRLDGIRSERRLQLRRAETDAVGRRRLEKELGELEALQRFALPLIEALDDLPEAAPWRRWLECLESLAARAVRAPGRILEVLAELRPMGDIGPVGLGEVQRVLEPRLNSLRGEPSGRRFGHVSVLGLSELRGRAFDYVFLPGLAEGIFPRRPGEDPLLPDADRRDLLADLPTRPRRVLRERRLLRTATAAAKRSLAFSYPSLDALQGRARVPSFYALDLLRAAEGRFPDLGRIERRAAAAAAGRLGWPAPRRPEQAIDDAEFDLSTLLELTDQAEPAKGSARYLLEMNPRLRRSLRNRYARWTSRRFSAADGLVVDGPSDLLAGHRLDARSYSPTALQQFAVCPYKFHLYAVLRLRPRETAERLEQLDPLTRGALFHEVVFQLFGALRERRLLPFKAERLDTLIELADDTLDAVAGRYAEELAPAIGRVYRSEVEALRLDLRGWIRAVIEEGDDFTPSRFELAFGLPADGGHDPASRREPVVISGDRRLRGSIDLVEIDDGRGLVRVTDFKTGRARRAPRQFRLGGGEVLQPLLYGLAAEQLLEEQVVAGRLFFSTRRGDFKTLDIALDDEGRDAVDVVLDAVDRAVAASFLPAAPRRDGCRYCDYRRICGPAEERRVARKRPDDRLGGLHTVRGLP